MPAKWHKYSYSAQQAERKNILFALLLLMAFSILFFLITHFAITMYALNSSTMQPTLTANDCVISTPFYRKFKASGKMIPPLINPERGDLVIINPAHPYTQNLLSSAVSNFLAFVSFQRFRPFAGEHPRSEQPTVRRLIGFPGDTLYMENFIVHIKPARTAHFLTEFELTEKQYNLEIGQLPENWSEQLPFSGSFPEITLSETDYFVMTDNRLTNGDSRLWGPIKGERLGGKVFFRYWPLSDIGRL